VEEKEMTADSSAPNSAELTVLLQRAAAGEEEAVAAVLPRIEAELRKIASIDMRGERRNHTLQTTAVVNEAYLRLFGKDAQPRWENRTHFFAVAARVIRHLLVDNARARRAGKRDGIIVPLDVAQQAAALGPKASDVLDVHLALEEFEKIAPRQAKLVELRFFVGLSLDEAAEVLSIAPRTADKDWALAKAWLSKRLGA
jgi:RNA polymerase sigma factor (TIGR02999 family)